MLVFGAIFILCCYGSTKIQIDTNVAGLFRDDHPLAVALNIVDNNMAGSQNMEIMIDTKISEGMLDADLLQSVDELQFALEDRYSDTIGRTQS